MILAISFLIKVFYWCFIGWWLRPILWLRERKIKKMQNEITKSEYKKIQQRKKEEN